MRVAVIGTSGAGKSTLARRLASRLGAPAVELDALNWGPDWLDLSRRDPDELARRVDRAIAGPAWVTDGNYSRVLPLILRRATHLVWLDYPRGVVMRRVIGRSILRSLSGRELWVGTGNREDWRFWLSKDHPIRWAWDTHAARRARYEAMLGTPSLAHLSVHRLGRPREAKALVENLVRRAEARA
jgi:adenylate kinase family enzyme